MLTISPMMSDLEASIGGDLGLAKVPAGAVTIAESPHRSHHQLVTRVDGPGPDRQGAQVRAAGVHDGLVHVIPVICTVYCVLCTVNTVYFTLII